MTKLTAKNISYKIKGTKILDDVSLSVDAGEHVVIIGPNGAGKSTLLGILTGDIKPTSGEVTLDDIPIDQISPMELARTRSVLMQSSSVAFSYTVSEVIGLGRIPWESIKNDSGDEKIIADAMAKADVTHLSQRDITSLSDGEQVRVAFARTLAQSCPLVLLDEPTANLDIGQHEHMLTLIKDLVSGGTTVITVLHDLDSAFSYADRIILLKNGRVFAQGSPEDVMTETILSEAYDHNIEIHRWEDQGSLRQSITAKKN